MANLLDEIRKAIDQNEKSRYAMSKETGISQSHLCQFMNGSRGLSYETLEILADYLGFEIIIHPKKKRKGGSSHGKKKV